MGKPSKIRTFTEKENSILVKCLNLIQKGNFIQFLIHSIIQILTKNKIDYYDCNFDEIVSLGYNCEISQRFCDIFKNKVFEHYLYTWSYEKDRSLFLKSFDMLNDFANSGYNIVPSGMIRHERSGIDFHSRFKKNDLIDANLIYTEKYYEALAELKSRLNYVALKTENLFKENKKVLFVMKMKYKNLYEDVKFVEKLSNIINNKYNQDTCQFSIIVVLSKRNYPKEELKKILSKKINHVYFESVDHFANDKYTDITGDIVGWHRILRKYIKENC